jgi:hypothetical protein
VQGVILKFDLTHVYILSCLTQTQKLYVTLEDKKCSR